MEKKDIVCKHMVYAIANAERELKCCGSVIDDELMKFESAVLDLIDKMIEGDTI